MTESQIISLLEAKTKNLIKRAEFARTQSDIEGELQMLTKAMGLNEALTLIVKASRREFQEARRRLLAE